MPTYQPETSHLQPLDPIAQSTLNNWERYSYPQIFINYRSGRIGATESYFDDVWASIILDDYLTGWFGQAAIFRATRSIPRCPGYPTLLRKAVAHCRVFLPIIGVGWENSLTGHPWVVEEIRIAAQTGKIILPIILREETHPAEMALAGENIDPLVSNIPGMHLGSRDTRRDTLEIVQEIVAHAPDIQIPQPSDGYGQHRLNVLFKD